jgi:hypothetical protein
MSQYQANTKLLTGMIRHDTDVSFQYNNTDDRIFDLHEVSQLNRIDEQKQFELTTQLNDELPRLDCFLYFPFLE